MTLSITIEISYIRPGCIILRAKIAFIHKLPRGLSKLLLEQLDENHLQLTTATMGEITQSLQEVINYLCVQQSKQRKN